MILKTMLGEREVADAKVERVFGRRVLALRGGRDELARIGALQTPWLLWHAGNRQYHRYKSIYDLVLAGMNARDFEGVFEGHEGDMQKMLTCLARLNYLRVFTGTENVTKQDVERMCGEIARGIGKTHSDTKKEILQLVAAAAEGEGAERFSCIAEAIGSTHARLAEISRISDVVVWQTNVLLARIRQQQRYERGVSDLLHTMSITHAKGKSSWTLRVGLETAISDAISACYAELDEPIAGLVLKTRCALVEAKRILYTARYEEVGELIRQRRLAHVLFQPFRQINRIIYRIAWAQRTKKRRDELFTTARHEMLTLITSLETDSRLSHAENPAPEALLWAYNANALANSSRPAWDEVKESLRLASASFG